MLVEMGFVISHFDPCVAINRATDVIVVFHVDDLFVTAPSVRVRDEFIEAFRGKFTVTVHVGNSLDYLGMHIDVLPGEIVLSQWPMIEKIVNGVTGKATSPAEDGDLDVRTPEMEVLLTQQAAAVYRGKIASCLYIAKRSRPDTLLAVNRLCRHAHTPTVQDELDLQRLFAFPVAYAEEKVGV